MKAHIARNQNAGVPLALGWNLSAADRGILEGMAPAFGMKLLPVSPADAGKTVAQLDLMKQAQVNIPLKAVVTPSNKNWVFGDLLAHLSEEHASFTTAAKEQA